MIKTVFCALISLTFLAGCQICPEKPPVIQYVYVVKTPPAELLELPSYPTLTITPTTMQSDIAEWVLELEQHTRELENKITKINLFFEAAAAEQLDKKE